MAWHDQHPVVRGRLERPEGIPLLGVGIVTLVGEYAVELDFWDVPVFTITRLGDLAARDTWSVGFNTLRTSH